MNTTASFNVNSSSHNTQYLNQQSSEEYLSPETQLWYKYIMCMFARYLQTIVTQNQSSTAEYEDTDERNYESDQFMMYIQNIVPVVYGLVTVIGSVGNLLVIFVIAADKTMRNTTNIFILSLAIADLAFITFCVPFTAFAYASSTWPFGDVWCRIAIYLLFVSLFASMYTLVALTADRFLAIVYPLSSIEIRRNVNAIKTVIILWIVILLGNTPFLIYSGVNRYDSLTVCDEFADDTDGTKNTVLTCTVFAVGYAIPLSLMCVLYGVMIKRVVDSRIPSESRPTNAIRTRKRVTRMIVVVVVTFALCWLPFYLLQICFIFGHCQPSYTTFTFKIIAHALSYMNSCLNPILYAFLSESFRKRFKNMLCRHCTRN